MMNGTAQEFQNMASQYNQMMMDTWSSWTKQTIQSESFSSASGAFMDWSLATHKMMTELSGQVMESLDIPKRSDLARLSAQIQSVETRILEQEDNQDDIKDLLVELTKKLDNLKAAPAAAPAKAPVVAAAATAPVKAEAKVNEEEKTAKPAAKAKKKTSSRQKSKARKSSKK